MLRRNLSITCVLLLLFVLLSACAKPAGPRPQVTEIRNDVKVYSGGQEIKDYSAQLVHRIDLNQQDISIIQSPADLPFHLILENDSRGKPRGLRVTYKQVAAPPQLGIKNRDLVTAFGKKLARSSADISALYEELVSGPLGMSSITLERSGKPHKILYYWTKAAEHY